MAGWRPPDSTPLEEIREARSALAGAREFLEAEQGRPGRVDLTVLTGGNSLALQLLHDALGYRTTNVQKRSARSAIATASRVLEEVSRGRDPTVEKAVLRSLALSKKQQSSRASEAAVAEAGKEVVSTIRGTTAGKSAESDPHSQTVTPVQSEAIRTQPRDSARIQVRRLTADGIQRARVFLAYMREHPHAKREPPPELLFGERYSRPFREMVYAERRPFRTRREVGEYFAPKFRSIRSLVVDHAGLWSWLGVYYFAHTVHVENDVHKLSPVDETFVFADSNDRHAYRHYLRSAWRLYEAHGESVAFLLDQDLTSFGDLAERVFGTRRIFNSSGVIQLILRLYTHGRQQRRGFSQRPGGLRQLVRVLEQLERTYDIYGMSPDSLVRIIPPEIRRWDRSPATRVLRGAVIPETATSADGDANTQTPTVSGEAPTVRQSVLNVRARIEQQGEVSWADPREHLVEGSEAWEAYVAVCGVPERRLFRTAFLHRLNEVVASLD